VECDFAVALGGHLFEVLVPGFARIEAKLLGRLTKQCIPGALHVIGGKGLAVVPFDAFAQPEAQLGLGRVPRPLARQIRHDRGEAGLRYVLIEHDEIVEEAHRRAKRRNRHFLVQRQARRAVEMIHPQRPARLLRQRGIGDEQCHQQSARRRERSKPLHHCCFFMRGILKFRPAARSNG